MRQKPTEKPVTFNVTPLTALPRPDQPKTGRPKKLTMPDLPEMSMSPLERQWFDFIISAYQQEYKDLTDTDKIYLPLIAIEYIKYLRTAKQEIESGELITMARQHPGSNLARLMENLSVTRKARKSDKTSEPDAKQEAMEKLSALWKSS